jgi:hypothetical protein
MNKVFNEGEPVYSPKFGKGFVLGVDVAKATSTVSRVSEV